MKPSFSSLKGLITNEAARDHYHWHVSLSTWDLLVLLMTLILTEMKMNTLYRYEYSWFYWDLSQNTVLVPNLMAVLLQLIRQNKRNSSTKTKDLDSLIVITPCWIHWMWLFPSSKKWFLSALLERHIRSDIFLGEVGAYSKKLSQAAQMTVSSNESYQVDQDVERVIYSSEGWWFGGWLLSICMLIILTLPSEYKCVWIEGTYTLKKSACMNKCEQGKLYEALWVLW